MTRASPMTTPSQKRNYKSQLSKSVQCAKFQMQITKNYRPRLSKISWFVSLEQINYWLKPKANPNNWSARHWQITIFCDDRRVAMTELNMNACYHSKTASEMRDPGNEVGWKLVFLIIIKIMKIIKALQWPTHGWFNLSKKKIFG